jgi:hypothetical protein
MSLLIIKLVPCILINMKNIDTNMKHVDTKLTQLKRPTPQHSKGGHHGAILILL